MAHHQNVTGAHPSSNGDAETLTRGLVEHLVRSAPAALVVHKVYEPDVIRVIRPEWDEGVVPMIEPFALFMAL